ncbi:MAG: hypothetical protein LC113_12005 [Acidobacteria bacterium]|nr:hypothetical protein [Acidobacteriota bacterium]
MLSTNSILRQGRFRVSQIIASNSSHTIYEAQDNLAAKAVLLCENAGLTLFGNSNAKYRGNGILEIADRFDENGRAYLVTEPLAGPGPWVLGNDRHNEADVVRLCERIRPIVDSVAQIRKQFPNAKLIEISPLYFRASLDGTVKLAFFERAQILGSNPSESPYLPLEAIWETLDFASQKAITVDYNEASLALLDAAPDHRTDLYSIAAVFYDLLAGSAPKSALERVIEMHDSGKDPLVSIDSLNPHVPARAAAELMKMLSLKRELRDDSLEAALLQPAMPVAPAEIKAQQAVAEPPKAESVVEQEAPSGEDAAVDEPQAGDVVPNEEPIAAESGQAEAQQERPAPAATVANVPVEAAASFTPAAKADDFDDLLEIPTAPAATVASPPQAQENVAVSKESPVEEAVEAPAAEVEPATARVEVTGSDEVVPSHTEEPVEAEPVAAQEPAVVESNATFSHTEEVIEEHPEPFIDESVPADPEPVEDEVTAAAHSPADEPYGGVHTRVEAASVPVVETPASVKTVSKEAVEASFSSAPQSFASVEPEAKSGSAKFIGIGAVALVVLAIGIWFISSMGGGEAAKPKAAPVAATVASDPAPQTQTQAPAETEAAPAAQAAVEDSPAAPEKAAAEPREAKPRAQIAEAKPAKPEQKPAAAATPAKAKKVSVDDLINDN